MISSPLQPTTSLSARSADDQSIFRDTPSRRIILYPIQNPPAIPAPATWIRARTGRGVRRGAGGDQADITALCACSPSPAGPGRAAPLRPALHNPQLDFSATTQDRGEMQRSGKGNAGQVRYSNAGRRWNARPVRHSVPAGSGAGHRRGQSPSCAARSAGAEIAAASPR